MLFYFISFCFIVNIFVCRYPIYGKLRNIYTTYYILFNPIIIIISPVSYIMIKRRMFLRVCVSVCRPTNSATLGKTLQLLHSREQGFKADVISYEPTCLRKKCGFTGGNNHSTPPPPPPPSHPTRSAFEKLHYVITSHYSAKLIPIWINVPQSVYLGRWFSSGNLKNMRRAGAFYLIFYIKIFYIKI